MSNYNKLTSFTIVTGVLLFSILSSSFVTVNPVTAQSPLNILGETPPVVYAIWDFWAEVSERFFTDLWGEFRSRFG
jgi:hypothetical protein